MYQKFVVLENNSYIEVTSRLYNGEDQVVLALRGVKEKGHPALLSLALDEKSLDLLIEHLTNAKKRDRVRKPNDL